MGRRDSGVAAGNRKPKTENSEPKTPILTTNASVIVLRAEALEQRDRLREWLHSLHGTVRHVDRRLTAARDGFWIRALRHEILDQLVVAARRGVMERRVAVVIAGVDVGAELF